MPSVALSPEQRIRNFRDLFRYWISDTQKTFDYIKKRGVRPFDYHIKIEINNELTPETWKKKEI